MDKYIELNRLSDDKEEDGAWHEAKPYTYPSFWTWPGPYSAENQMYIPKSYSKSPLLRPRSS